MQCQSLTRVPPARNVSRAAGGNFLGIVSNVAFQIRQMTTTTASPAAYTNNKWWTRDTVAVVTGSNKGIGKEIAKLLAGQQLTVVATARNEEQGKAAVAEISAAAGPESRVVFHTLDVSDPQSHKQFRDWLQKEFGTISILVNNAGFAYKGDIFGPQELRATLATNYYGTAGLTEALLPLIKDGEGRVVTVSSRAGLSRILKSEDLKRRFLEAHSKEEIDSLVDEFIALVEKGDEAAMAAAGWPKSMYGVSKLAISSYCHLLAGRVEPRGVRVAACCPGWCRTDMSSGGGNKTAEEGADTPVWLALQPPSDLPSGLLWGERAPVTL